LHIGDLRFLQPFESHHLFGAGFIFIGTLMIAESLAGKIWHASLMRTLVFPATLVFLGWGMIVVTFVEPNARLVHLAMGIPMIAAGWAEARCRLDNFPRRYADAFIVPALLLASLETLGFHLQGPPLSASVLTHGGLAALAIVIAGLRLYQSGSPQSLLRGVLVAGAVIAVGLDLWVDGFFQGGGQQ
jgi:hypothetical protein